MPDGPVLVVPARAWASFVTALKDGPAWRIP
ncbi:DUF397 domain-containing protein [Streptomyces sp. NPDC059011]